MNIQALLTSHKNQIDRKFLQFFCACRTMPSHSLFFTTVRQSLILSYPSIKTEFFHSSTGHLPVRFSFSKVQVSEGISYVSFSFPNVWNLKFFLENQSFFVCLFSWSKDPPTFIYLFLGAIDRVFSLFTPLMQLAFAPTMSKWSHVAILFLNIDFT